jgi:hypothetical protein
MSERIWVFVDEGWEEFSDFVDWGDSLDDLFLQVRAYDHELANKIESAVGEKCAVIAESSFLLGLEPPPLLERILNAMGISV